VHAVLDFQTNTFQQFANMALHIGPGTGSQLHCLARSGDAAKTANTNAGMVDACNARSDYADMAACQEGGVHAWGHNGIGAVMQDVYASPSDPVFWLHHGFVDRNFRIWQGANSARVQGVTGTDKNGNAINLDTGLDIQGLRTGVKIRDVLNTQAGILCYKYNY
jgi:tyrosinase